MLAHLLDHALNQSLRCTHAYLGHLTRSEEDGEKRLDRADALAWDQVDPVLQQLFLDYLTKVLEGEPGEKSFVTYYTGEPVSVDRFVHDAAGRAQSRPAVEVFQAICDRAELTEADLIALGNQIAYKALATMAVKDHLLGILRFEVLPVGAAAPVPFAFATLFELSKLESPFFDADRGTVELRAISGMIRGTGPAKAAIFPCLDDYWRESGDLLVYATSAGGSWFDALEMQLRLSPARQGKALLGMIAGQIGEADAPPDLFEQLAANLLPHAVGGLQPAAVADALEKSLGYGIDRQALGLRWETVFGAEYRPEYASLFGEGAPPAKLAAGEVAITVKTGDLPRFRQVRVGNETFIVMHVAERAGITLGKDNTLAIEPIALESLLAWIRSRSGTP